MQYSSVATVTREVRLGVATYAEKTAYEIYIWLFSRSVALQVLDCLEDQWIGTRSMYLLAIVTSWHCERAYTILYSSISESISRTGPSLSAFLGRPIT
jgi:hypothetical protein